MKNYIILSTLLFSFIAQAQTLKNEYLTISRKILEENVGNSDGILVARTYAQREYSNIDIISENAKVISIALTRIDGSVELIVPNGENGGQIIGTKLKDGSLALLSLTADATGYICDAYSSKRGAIRIVTKSWEMEGGEFQSFDIIKDNKILVKLWFDL